MTSHDINERVRLSLRHLEGRLVDNETILEALEGCVAGLYFFREMKPTARERTVMALGILIDYTENELRLKFARGLGTPRVRVNEEIQLTARER